MRISRVIVEAGSAVSRTFEFDSNMSLLTESPADTERLLAVFRNLFLGVKRGCQIFATIDDVEFEITSDMVPLIGQRLRGQFRVLDLALPPVIESDPADIREVHVVVARAALETVGATGPTLDLDRLDRGTLAIDRFRYPLLHEQHAADLHHTGLRQLFSRRQELIDADDPAVRQLARFDQVLADRRRQISSSSAPLPDEFAHATDILRELASARMGGVSPETAAAMDSEAVERDIAQWVMQQHDRQITPIVAKICARHAEGVATLGAIPIVIDLRRIDGLLPGGDAMRWAACLHSEQLQFVLFVADDDSRRWVESALASSSTISLLSRRSVAREQVQFGVIDADQHDAVDGMDHIAVDGDAPLRT